jgi:hypothetical protein
MYIIRSFGLISYTPNALLSGKSPEEPVGGTGEYFAEADC